MSRQLRSTAGLFAISLAIPILALVLAACGQDTSGTASSAEPTAQATQPIPAGVKTIYLAGGCFWGLEKYVGLVHGVVEHRGRLRERRHGLGHLRRRQRLRRGRQGRLRPAGRAAAVPARACSTTPSTRRRSTGRATTSARSTAPASTTPTPPTRPSSSVARASCRRSTRTPIAIESGPAHQLHAPPRTTTRTTSTRTRAATATSRASSSTRRRRPAPSDPRGNLAHERTKDDRPSYRRCARRAHQSSPLACCSRPARRPPSRSPPQAPRPHPPRPRRWLSARAPPSQDSR